MRIRLFITTLALSLSLAYSQGSLERSFIYSRGDASTDLFFIELPPEPGIDDGDIVDGDLSGSTPWIVYVIMGVVYVLYQRYKGVKSLN
ncbi:MAG: hypothetical protein ACRCZM_08065 [Bacteroidales bacterium]